MTNIAEQAIQIPDLELGKDVLYLTKQDVLDLAITRSEILDITRETLVEHGNHRYEMPAKIGVHPYTEVFYHAMPAYVPGMNAVGCKWIECYPNNPQKFGIPQTTGLMVINDVESGVPVAIMDSTWVTAMRTPAVTVLAAAKLHPGAESFGMFGCGVQGKEHVRYAAEALPGLKTLYVYDNREAAADALIDELQDHVPFTLVKGESPEAVTKSAEVLSSATVILKEPLSVVKDEWVGAGQTILPCDLNTFWDPRIAQRADKYIVDSIEEHELFAGMGYFPDGLPAISAETGEVIADVKPGRESSDQLIVNSNIGMAVCDVTVGRAIFDRAVAKQAGTRLAL
ncbi:ornithine cyclodeaminase family protein [Streptomyces benahoarensis]|uniref:Ornithine cyclodeaminase family protein n=1 Tax=Streptomyces benahoarensis TaxID=2595054 RepID=A0A553ZFN6_9ACTN|nr:ornithine cyclodeaminase family protein [Streptomyces benahoarensis]TSB21330.1 ornithine cyclodeaminase family protein [Streptomyces benahoarensis]TSB40210.1 ornithine cyclodeaminase family protein [Streptomyces benahoarensis]